VLPTFASLATGVQSPSPTRSLTAEFQSRRSLFRSFAGAYNGGSAFLTGTGSTFIGTGETKPANWIQLGNCVFSMGGIWKGKVPS
jgi:hypothetical protein